MISIVVLLASHSALLFASIAAGAVMFRRVRGGQLVALGGGLVSAGVLAYLTGIVWFASPTVGLGMSRVVPVACLAYVAVTWARERRIVAETLVSLIVPMVLTGLWAAVTLAMGFLFGGEPAASQVAASRYSDVLPADNQLPYLLARHVEQAGHTGPPLHVGDWLSSDRPPLQSAFVLAHTLWHRGDASSLLDYQVLGTLLQSTWVLGVWALVLVVTTRRSVRALMIAGAAASGQVLLNSFFIWPKLLAAAFTLAALAFVLDRSTESTVMRLSFASVAAALGYLSHGGVVFALIPVALVAAWQALRGGSAWRTMSAAVAAACVLVVPWALYQRFYDPPGDRLLKWMLADVQDVRPGSVAQVITERYRVVGFGDAIRNKLANVEIVVGYPAQPLPLHAASDFDSVIRYIRVAWFYSLIPTFGLLLLLAFGWLAARRACRTEVRAQLALLGVWLAGLVDWCLLMFGPRTTAIHQGTYAFVLVGVVLLVGAGALASVRATTVIVVLQALATLLIYTPLIPIAGVEWMQTAHVGKQALAVLVISASALVAVLAAYAHGGQRSVDVEPLGPVAPAPDVSAGGYGGRP